MDSLSFEIDDSNIIFLSIIYTCGAGSILIELVIMILRTSLIFHDDREFLPLVLQEQEYINIFFLSINFLDFDGVIVLAFKKSMQQVLGGRAYGCVVTVELCANPADKCILREF